MTTIHAFHEEGKPQKPGPSECCHRGYEWKDDWKGKGCTSNRDDCSPERIVGKSRFKNLGDLHEEWIRAGVSAPRASVTLLSRP